MAETLRELVVALSLDSSKVFTLISLRKQQIAKLDELVKARFVEMFGDPVKNPKNGQRSALMMFAMELVTVCMGHPSMMITVIIPLSMAII